MIEEILDKPDGDGYWLFREDEERFWRLTNVSGVLASGLWIVSFIFVDNINGKWRRRTKVEQDLAASDSNGRLCDKDYLQAKQESLLLDDQIIMGSTESDQFRF